MTFRASHSFIVAKGFLAQRRPSVLSWMISALIIACLAPVAILLGYKRIGRRAASAPPNDRSPPNGPDRPSPSRIVTPQGASGDPSEFLFWLNFVENGGLEEPAKTVGGDFRVFVDDNFHHMDEEERTEYGAYATLEEATEACRKIVQRSLANAYQPDMSANDLFARYTSFGDDPFIRGPQAAEQSGVSFSGWTYARARAEEMCGRGRPT